MRRFGAAAVALACACGSSGGGGGNGAVGKATGAALVAAIDAATAVVEPWRCARFDEPIAQAAPPGWTLDGRRLSRAGKRAAATRIAVVAEARGGGAATQAAIAGIRAALDAEPVDVVVSLGGLGATRAEIAGALAPLASEAPWVVVAIPGDREAVAEHRAAVAELAGAGAPVVDGSQVRVVTAGAAAIGTLPGAPFEARLAAGAAGCVHDDEDVAATLRALATAAADDKRPPMTVIAGQRTPRGRSDLAPGGVHAGDVAYASVLSSHPVDVVVHGAVDDVGSAAGRAARKPRGATGVRLETGALDATPRYRPSGARVSPSALVITVGEREAAWKPLAPRVVP